VNPYPADDPRHFATFPEQIARVKAATASDVKRVYDLFVGGAHGELAVVGDFDSKTIEPQLEALFKDWKNQEPFERLVKRGDLPYEPGEQVVKTPDKANMVYFAGLVLPVRDDDADMPALLIGNYILGGGGGLSSRLGDRVRQKDGLSYGVGSGMRISSVDKRTSFYVFAIANPANVEKLKAAIREEFDLLLAKGVTAQELAAAKKGYLQQNEVERADDGGLSGELANSLLAGRTLAFDATFSGQSLPQVVSNSVQVTAGAGTAILPCAASTKPSPRATVPAYNRSIPSSSMPHTVPITSRIASTAPTSCRCTFSTVVPWTAASASIPVATSGASGESSGTA